ncbi:MAG: transcription-repair coupling factor [Candidatus Cryptobacteroides sp.]|nr:transcription-repair coupling factor [Candidatus Cryptobacteroides sp.]
MLISEHSTAALQEALASGQKDIYCQGLFLSARWFVLSGARGAGMSLVVLPDKESAEYCAADLYNLTEGDKVFYLPDSGKNAVRSNYKSSLGVQRTSAIGKIRSCEPGTVIVSYPEALEERLPSSSDALSPLLSLKAGDEISHDEISSILSEAGFENVDFVSEPGQYTLRGGVVDIFSYSFNYPFRLSLFGNEIEKIYTFDTNTQLSKESVDKVEIYGDMASDSDTEGLFISDILPEDCIVWLDSSDSYREREFFSRLSPFRKVYLETPLSAVKASPIRFDISPQPAFNKNFDLLIQDIKNRLEKGYKVYIYGEKRSQLERLRSIILAEEGTVPEMVEGKNLHNGFIDHESRCCIYSDHEIFDRFHRVRMRRSVEKSEQLTINELSSFNIGDYVVHIDYGVCVFGGLVRMKDDRGRMHEVVKLMFKDNDTIFLSVHSLHKISRFKSKDSEPPKINRLGSKAWQNLKASAKSRVKDIAKDLIKLYARRKASKGFAFSPDTYLQTELESSFMYEDTPDQEKAVAATKRDMEDTCPMDRLVCGDVGFGKTEVAIRAAFKAVADSKQVAVLVPTTILCLQHYNTFSSRLKDFPCNVEYVSRLRSAKEISDIKERLKKGGIDIIIGTHKLLNSAFEFKDLGLLIIDEEQKFGVSSKEKLRQLKESIDTLTLTATPIPRTLQFSLLGARDLSIINTPPPNRIPVQTEIILFDKEEIRSIINYELNRDGQIFFLHNRVEELDGIYNILHGLVPDMRICVAHGQMEAKVLENKILAFMKGEYDLLLCTTIIENGLDIPNANTILINQAQNIGLSDLHQLRGRVGRSNRRAFCYLIVPPLASVTDEARRRLKAIESFSDLGSGFSIAMQDLDIRGAGNLLGAEQSGFITDMGFETYQKILQEAIEELGMESGISTRRDESSYISDCTVETDQLALIPDDYIDVNAEKIRIYKDMDSAGEGKQLDRIHSMMEDRFGKMPPEVERLFDIVRIRNIAASLGFEKVIVKNGIMICFFISNPLSPFYKSGEFSKTLERISLPDNAKYYELKQSNDRLKIVCRNVDGTSRALELLRNIK